MAPAPSSHTQKSDSRTGYLILAFGLLCVFVLYMPVVRSLVAQWWDDDNYRHGFLVPVISMVVLYLRRDALRTAPPGGGTVVGALILLAAAALLIVGTSAAELMTMRLSLPTFVLGAALYLRGQEFTRRALFPLLLLYLMVPLPYIMYYKIAFPLQLVGATLSADFLEFIGVNVVRRGNVLYLPGYSLEVVAACSGLRSLMTMVTLSLVVGAFSGLSLGRRFVLVLFAVPAALAANMVRLIVTSLGAYMVSPSFADGFLHTFSGIVVFLTGLSVLFVVFLILRKV